MIDITINNTPVSVPEGSTILEAAKMVNIKIPTLCHMNLDNNNYVNKCASCRVCVVEVEGRKNLAPACETTVTPGMVIRTSTPKAITARKTVVELLLSDHPQDCLSCAKNMNCELQALANEMGIRELPFEGDKSTYKIDDSSPSFVRDMNKCIMCRRCESVCNKAQGMGIYSAVDRGFDAVVDTAFCVPLTETNCTNCGQCVTVCPVGALTEVDNTGDVLKALADPEKFVVVQTAPAVRAGLGEEFGIPAGTSVTGKMAAALRRLGFDRVLDTDFAADLTIMEEANELVQRITTGGKLPILTSCCPAWVKFYESEFPDLLEYPSSCKSPHEMMGAIIKTYLAEKVGVDPKNVYVVSIMPCVAKKFEADREELGHDGLADVDIVLSTRELAKLIKTASIDFAGLPDEDFDHPLGESTGAAVIFGVTGGVIEAATRTAYEWVTGETLEKVDFEPLRGMEGIRKATVQVGDLSLNIGIANGLANARVLMEQLRNGECEFHAIEVMACPGGCVNGGGQPFRNDDWSKVAKRAAALYQEDADKPIRVSHKNTQIIKLYDEFLTEPGSEKAHHLLHTHYVARDSYTKLK